jgi:hypothetical protein
MKPVSMWCTLGMSLFLVLSMEARAQSASSAIPTQANPALPTRLKPQVGAITVLSGPLTATVFIDGSGELFVENPATGIRGTSIIPSGKAGTNTPDSIRSVPPDLTPLVNQDPLASPSLGGRIFPDLPIFPPTD